MSDQPKRRGNPNMRKGAPSINPSGRARADAVEPVGHLPRLQVVEREDGWTNLLTGMGVSGRDNRLATTFCSDTVSNATARELWRGDDLAARGVETYPYEMLRQGYTIKIGSVKAPVPKPQAPDPMEIAAAAPPVARTDAYGPEDETPEAPDLDEDSAKELQEQLVNKLEELGVDGALFDALCYENAYGGGAILLGAQDGQTLDKPLDLERVTDLTYVTALEPEELSAVYWYADPLAPKYGQPEIYQLTPISSGSARNPKPVQQVLIHESRLVIFPGIRVSKRIIGASGSLGWGDSIFTRVIRVLRDFNTTWSSASVLVNDFAIAVYKLKNLAEMVGTDNSKLFKARMRSIEESKSVLKGVMLDAENEDYERKSTSLAGLPDMLDKFAARYAAAMDMPLTILFGMSPGGLNATGESDIRGFYDKTKSKQSKKLTGPLKRIIQILFRVLGAKEPDQWCVEFKPLWQPTDKEIAETRLIVAQADQIYAAGIGAVTPEEVGVSRWGGDGYSMEMTVDFSAKALEEREANRAAEAEMKVQAMQAAKPPPAEPTQKADAYDPDQPRDENGRWGEGGGSSHPAGSAKQVTKIALHAGKGAENVARAYTEEERRDIYSTKEFAGATSFSPEDLGQAHFEYHMRAHLEEEQALQKGIVKAPPSKVLERFHAELSKVAKPFQAAATDVDRHQREALEHLRAAEAARPTADDIDDDNAPEHINIEDARELFQESAASSATAARAALRVASGEFPDESELSGVRDAVEGGYAEEEHAAGEEEQPPSFDRYREHLTAAADSLAKAIESHTKLLEQSKVLAKVQKIGSKAADDELDDDTARDLVAPHLASGEEADSGSAEAKAYEEAYGIASQMVDREIERRQIIVGKTSFDHDEVKHALREAKSMAKEVNNRLAEIAGRRSEKSAKFTQGRTGLEEAKARLAARKAAKASRGDEAAE